MMEELYPTIRTITCEEPYIYIGDNNGKYVNGKDLGFSFYDISPSLNTYNDFKAIKRDFSNR